MELQYIWIGLNLILGLEFTVNFLNIQTPKKFVVIILKFELCGTTIEKWVQTMQMKWQTM